MGTPNPKLMIGIAVAGLGLILHIVGMATPAWTTSGSVEYGVFEACGQSVCASIKGSALTSSHEAVQAMTIIGVLAGAGGVLAALLIVLLAVLGKNQMSILATLAALGCLVGFGFIILGVIIWGAKIHDDFKSSGADVSIGYSFILSVVGGILLAVGGVLSYLGARGD